MNATSAAFPQIGPDQVWRDLLHPVAADSARRPLLCLDRDGVVVEEVNYLSRVADCRLIDGAAQTIRTAHAAGWGIALLTNQAGIARGYFGWAEFAEVNRYMLDLLGAQNARIDLVLAVPHHPAGSPPYGHPDHPMRKPNPGMLAAAMTLLHGDPAASLMVGDKADDLLAARRAGLGCGCHVLSGHGVAERQAALALAGPDFQVVPLADIGDVRLRARLAAAGNRHT